MTVRRAIVLEYNEHGYYPSDMEDNIGSMMAQVARLMRRHFDERARAIGVTRPQWQVITLLSRNPGINQGGLADLLEVEPITLGRMIDRMQDAGLVERRSDPGDRRAWRLFLTPHGEDLIDKLRPFANDTLDSALSGIDRDEVALLMRTLDRMRSNLARKA